MTEKDTNENLEKLKLNNDTWMIRKCSFYDEEYKDCTSIKARLNQLFIFGKALDCTHWKKDSVNCYKWCDKSDNNAAIELIESEKKRRYDRLAPHYQNNVWTKRKNPPENWNAELPEYLQKQYEGSYLYLKSKELKGEIPPTFDPSIRSCTIL